MRGKITERLVETIEHAERAFDVRDTELKGFFLRVQPSGAKSFGVVLSRTERRTLGPTSRHTAAEARAWARRLLARRDARDPDDPVTVLAPDRPDTLADLLDRYERSMAGQKRTGAADLKRVRKHFEHFLLRPLSTLTSERVEIWRAERLEAGVAANTLNRDLAPLRAALNSAVEFRWLARNPIAGVKPAKVDTRGRVRFLSDDEEQRLRAAIEARETRRRTRRESGNQWRRERGKRELEGLDGAVFTDHLAPLVLVSLNTGLRRGELFGLEWKDVDFSRRMLRVRGDVAKTGETRHVPMNAEVVAALGGWQSTTGQKRGLVFPGREGGRLDNVNKAWTALLAEAGIEEFRWHDMRHHFASRLAMNGVDLNRIRVLLGHSSTTMVLRYAHLQAEDTAAAVELLVRRPVAGDGR